CAARGRGERDRDEDGRHEPFLFPRVRHFSVHSESDATSLTKIRWPETAGWAQVALSATVYRFSGSNPVLLLLATISSASSFSSRRRFPALTMAVFEAWRG